MFLVLFIFAFMLSAAFSLRDKSFLGLSEDSPAMLSVQQFTVEVRQYVNIMTVINFMVAIGDTLILALLGIPFAVLWGILAFFMGFIPSIGWWISLIPPFLIAWAQFGIGTAMIVLLVLRPHQRRRAKHRPTQDDGEGSAHIAPGRVHLGDLLGDGARRHGRPHRRAHDDDRHEDSRAVREHALDHGADADRFRFGFGRGRRRRMRRPSRSCGASPARCVTPCRSGQAATRRRRPARRTTPLRADEPGRVSASRL